MRYYFSYLFLLLTLVGCVVQKRNTVLNDSSFTAILENYIKKNDEIPNSCNATPFYKIYFKSSNDSLSFWVGAHLGVPSPVLPNEPGTEPAPNPIEIKGYTTVNKRLVVFYDYVSSNGHGLYDPSRLNKYYEEVFEYLPEGCGNVLYPEALNYGVLKGNIYLKGKREAFQLQ
ncbi:MAG: hypothetical protein JXP36_13940 [Bacteroidales bacterium]|nr:hypothetical protein [Bacteroidales bacterium]